MIWFPFTQEKFKTSMCDYGPDFFLGEALGFYISSQVIKPGYHLCPLLPMKEENQRALSQHTHSIWIQRLNVTSVVHIMNHLAVC